jgi:hypothetical protein
MLELERDGKMLGLTGKDLTDWMRDERQVMRQMEKENREAQQNLKLEELKLKQGEEKRLLKEAEVQLAQLKLQQGPMANVAAGNLVPKCPKVYKEMPPYDPECDDIDAYILRFERMATVRGWPVDDWAASLSVCLKGEALNVYSRLSPNDATDFSQVKTALLQRFGCTVDGYREKFRFSKPFPGETATQFLARLESFENRWIDLASITKDYDSLRQLMLCEQFHMQVNKELSIYLKERDFTTTVEMATAGDRYLLAQRWVSLLGPAKRNATDPAKEVEDRIESPNNSSNRENRCGKCNRIGHRMTDCKIGLMKCFTCNESGHRAANCPRAKKKAAAGEKVEKLDEDSGEGFESGDKIGGIVLAELKLDKDVSGAMGKARSYSELPVVAGCCNDTKVTVMRDSGCNTVIVRSTLVKNEDRLPSKCKIRYLDSSEAELPEAMVYLDCPYYTGKIKALHVAKPLYDVVLGNIPGVRKVDSPNRRWKHH